MTEVVGGVGVSSRFDDEVDELVVAVAGHQQQRVHTQHVLLVDVDARSEQQLDDLHVARACTKARRDISHITEGNIDKQER